MDTERLIKKLLREEITRRQFLKATPPLASGAITWLQKTTKIDFEPPPRPPTVEEKVKQYQNELETKVKPVFFENQEAIAQLRENGILGNFEILEMYYPIYRIAQDRFNVPWHLLWLIHDAESTGSQDPQAFNSPIHFGAMQRAIAFYPNREVEEITQGFEYLGTLSQNHFHDWKEILWAASKLNRDAQEALKLNPFKDRQWALEDALDSYSEREEAKRRKARFRTLGRIFL